MMKYYKIGLQASRTTGQNKAGQVSGISDLPKPLPTVLLYFALLGGAIVWTKSGGF